MNYKKVRFPKLYEHGCVVCKREYGRYSEPHIHHVRAGLGTGQKRNDARTIPLCPDHHMSGGYGVAFHSGRKHWEELHGTEEELLEYINAALESM